MTRTATSLRERRGSVIAPALLRRTLTFHRADVLVHAEPRTARDALAFAAGAAHFGNRHTDGERRQQQDFGALKKPVRGGRGHKASAACSSAGVGNRLWYA